MQPSVKILVACHKKYPVLHTDVFTPIHVGRAIASEPSKRDLSGFLSDDTGDNISAKNPHFCELTAMYWAWKNMAQLGNPDYIGMAHYRRLFNFRSEARTAGWNGKFDDLSSVTRYRFGWMDDFVRGFCRSRDIIVGEAWHPDRQSILDLAQSPYPYSQELARRARRLPERLTLYEHYAGSHFAKDIDLTLDIAKDMYPEMSAAIDRAMSSKAGHFANMFVMKRQWFEAYATWLFRILFEVEGRIGPAVAKYDPYQARIYGFLSERLMNAFLEYHRSTSAVPLVVGECQALMANEAVIHQSASLDRGSQPREQVSVAFALDDGYAAQTGTAITSLLLNSDPRTCYHLYLLDRGLSAENRKRFENLKQICDCKISFLDMQALSQQYRFQKLAEGGELSHLNDVTFYRLLLPSLLPDVDKVIYLDSDLIVRKDLAKLFRTELNDNYLGMASDMWVRADLIPHDSYFKDDLGLDGEYFNAGVAVFDLARMRKDGVQKTLLDYLSAHGPLRYNDQDLLNAVLKGRIQKVDLTWNTTRNCWLYDSAAISPTENRQVVASRNDPAIAHYAGDMKPWNRSNSSYFIPYEHEYQPYRDLSPWNDAAKQGYREESPFVSVVIPTYNVAALLPQCLHAVAHQTLQNIEIIVVDDGSTDASADIAEASARSDRRIKVLRQPHRGLRAACNAGMTLAQGEYVGFVNAEDPVDVELFEKLYNRALAANSDVVISDVGASVAREATQPLQGREQHRAQHRISVAADRMPEILRYSGMQDTIYRRSLLQAQGTTFPTTGSLDEGHGFGSQVLPKAERISLVWERLSGRRNRLDAASCPEVSDDGVDFPCPEIMHAAKRHFVEHGDYSIVHRLILQTQILTGMYYFKRSKTRNAAKDLFAELRALLDDEDYASLATIACEGDDSLVMFASYLHSNAFDKCYCRMKWFPVAERLTRAAYHLVPTAARRKAFAIAKNVLPRPLRQAIGKMLPLRVKMALAR